MRKATIPLVRAVASVVYRILPKEGNMLITNKHLNSYGLGDATLRINGHDYPARICADNETCFRTIFTVPGANSLGETMEIELTIQQWQDFKQWKCWIREGWIRKMSSLCFLSTYVTDADGFCWGKYNPQSKPREDRPGSVVDFSWLLSGEEADKIVAEAVRRFEAAGMDA